MILWHVECKKESIGRNEVSNEVKKTKNFQSSAVHGEGHWRKVTWYECVCTCACLSNQTSCSSVSSMVVENIFQDQSIYHSGSLGTSQLPRCTFIHLHTHTHVRTYTAIQAY